MIRLLLDTHAFLWWLAGDRRLSMRARRAIGVDDNVVFVSAASAWEIATKHRLGKLPGVDPIVDDLSSAIASQSFDVLPISVPHAQKAGSLSIAHRDPFDRMLIAQAQLENLRLVSNERLFSTLGVDRLW